MKQFVVRDTAGKVYFMTLPDSECKRYGDDAPYRRFAKNVLKIDVGPDFDTGNVDIDVECVPAKWKAGTVELFQDPNETKEKK